MRFKDFLNDNTVLLNEGVFVNSMIGMAVMLVSMGMSSASGEEFSKTDGRMSIKTTVGGVEGNFLLDSGAGRFLLTPEFAERIETQQIATRTATTATGSVQVPVVLVDDVMIAGTEHDDVKAVIISTPGLANYDGAISAQEFVGKALTIDYSAKKFELTDPGKSTLNPRVTIRGEVASSGQHALSTFVMVKDSRGNSHRVRAMIDTGAAVTLINPAFAQQFGIRTRDGGQSRVNGQPVQLANIRALGIGNENFAVEDHLVGALNLPTFKDQPGIIIGVDVLKKINAVSLVFDTETVAVASTTQ